MVLNASIKSNEKCREKKRERINLWFSQFNKLFELWMYAVNVLYEQNLIKSKCWLHELACEQRVRILFILVAISVAFECQNYYHKHKFNFQGVVNWFEWVQFIWESLWWKVMCKPKRMHKLVWWTAYLNRLSAFVRQTQKSLYTHTHNFDA